MKKQKLRYYLRGLGIGVLVTAIILGIAGKDEGTMTDAQIRERALELGMVDADSIVLSELQSNDVDESEPTVQESEEQDSTEIPETQTVESEEELSAESESAEIESEETIEETVEETSVEEIVTITIHSGANSYGVSKDLAEAGLIENAGDFDTYLCDNGYSKSIRIGTYEIAIGTGEEEIAKIITGKR